MAFVSFRTYSIVKSIKCLSYTRVTTNGLFSSVRRDTEAKRRRLNYSAFIKQCQASLSTSVESKHCWKCHTNISAEDTFCLSCKCLQPFIDGDHFSILGMKKNFTIDTKDMTKKFRRLQAHFHPDRYTRTSEREQQFAHDHSSAINKAYRCLLHPVERALYLLELAGQPLHEGQIDLDPEFLSTIMEMNEELAEANDRDTVQAIGQRNMEILNNLLREADAAFSSGDIETARIVVAKIKYYNNIYEKVKDYERQHGIVN